MTGKSYIFFIIEGKRKSGRAGTYEDVERQGLHAAQLAVKEQDLQFVYVSCCVGSTIRNFRYNIEGPEWSALWNDRSLVDPRKYVDVKDASRGRMVFTTFAAMMYIPPVKMATAAYVYVYRPTLAIPC